MSWEDICQKEYSDQFCEYIVFSTDDLAYFNFFWLQHPVAYPSETRKDRSMPHIQASKTHEIDKKQNIPKVFFAGAFLLA